MKYPLLKIAALSAMGLSSVAAADHAGVDFFERKVRPLLVERCFECHSAEKKIKGGLSLDSQEGWRKGGDTGPALVPNDVEKSLLIEAVRYKNRDLQMPPKQKLSSEEVGILEEWVKSGAPDPRVAVKATQKQQGLSVAAGRKFWCYAPVKETAAPVVKNTAWAHSGIDRFLLAKMEASNRSPAPDATPEVLARRLYFTLSGLPPTPEELQTFLLRAGKDRLSAITELVDELLASPRFGETWGRHWLDVVRFAESSGGGRTLLFKDAWRFRDYVVSAFNADLPFDQFIREQLAGDLLPSKDASERRRKLTATAFLALGPTNYEEQDKQLLRFDVIDEQLETVGRAFLGQTIGCARCHDHKFDPIPQKDYYALAGIFASTKTLFNYTDNVARWISIPLPAEAAQEEAAVKMQEERLAALRKELETAQAELSAASASLTAAGTGAVAGTAIPVAQLSGIILDDGDAKVVGEWKHSTFVRSFIGKGYLSDNNTGKGEKTVTFTPIIPKTARYEVRLAYTHAPGRAKNVRVNILHADGEDTVFVDQTEVPPIDGRFVSLGKYRFENDGAGYVMISNEGTTNFVTVDALQLLEEGAPAVKGEDFADNKAAADSKKRVRELEAAIKKAIKEGARRETTMAVEDDPHAADTQIRIRGVERQRGETVPRGFLQVALQGEAPPISGEASGRLQLADWIASAQNPLTARVQVNRIWNWLFGAGIVRSVDNFGTTGDVPSHPELLDYLATRFVQEGWSVKKLIREIVLSRGWQQAVSSADASDPENALFAHANRRRLSAEQLRDALLWIGGNLDTRVGGPNIKGAGDIDANNSSAQNIEYAYVFEDNRRGVYTPAFRNKRLELFEVFDFGNINQPMGQRNTSTVAPQALYLLNHPFVAQQASLAAAQTLAQNENDEARLTRAFTRILGRPPRAAERLSCQRFLANATCPPEESWQQLHQMLFCSIDFRYLE